MPAVSPEKLLEKLSRGRPVPGIVLQGADSYLREMCRKRISEAYVPDEGMHGWAIGRLSARQAGWDEIVQRAQTLPMLAPLQVIFVEDVESVEKLGDKARDHIITLLGEYLDSPAPFTVLVLEASSLDGRQRFCKLLAEKTLVVELSIDSESAPAFAAQMAKELGVEIDRDAASFLAEILNGEPARMHIELEKLAVYVRGTNQIRVADVEALVVSARKNTIWQFADLIAEGKRREALEFLDNLLREGDQPAGMLGAIAWRYRQLIENRGAITKSFGQSHRYGGSFSAPQSSSRVPMKYLISGLQTLAEADSQLKSSNPDPRAFMEFLVARLTMRSAA